MQSEKLGYSYQTHGVSVASGKLRASNTCLCALNEVLALLVGDGLSNVLTIVAPFVMAATKLKMENRISVAVDNTSVYRLQVGASSGLTKALCSNLQSPPPWLQIFSEQLTCLFQLVRVLQMPTFVIIGKKGQKLHRYGFFAPLIATFEAIGENITCKIFHCFVDGCISTLKGSCTVVRDFTDFCYHSYFSYMDELSEEMHPADKPIEVKLSKLPSCILVSLVAIPVEVPFITALALWKNPFMLFRGWKRLLEDLIGGEGPFLETVCVPFAGLAIILWPLAVAGSVVASSLSSFALALYSGVVVHQEDSFRMGLSYILAAVSIFDEYTNDLFDMREGSCFMRLQGIVGSLSRVPTFRRRFKNLVKVLYLEAIQIGLVADTDGGSSKAGNRNKHQVVKGDRKNTDEGARSSRDGDSIV
ncbi:hypothetical protein HAX54_038999 [Datura stramonium]|uniref:DUF7894 domain-containing protein n=1 Tax=Datura stramonium TaxID=4076 RepID=A0ABS8VLV5_DATST|nr:hypothetical protein [Datura stramonium]